MAERKIQRVRTITANPRNVRRRRNSTSTSADVSSPTSTSADVSSPTSTKTATDAYTGRNVTVTGGAGSGATTVKISHQPDGPEQIGRSHRSAAGDLADLPMESQFRGGKNEPLQSRFRENAALRTLRNGRLVLFDSWQKPSPDYVKVARGVYRGVKVEKGGAGWMVTADGYWKKVQKLADKQNPSESRFPSEYAAAVEASEEFHGTPAHELLEIKTEVFEHDSLADLGELVSMDIAAIGGGIVKLSGFEGARLARSPKGFPCQLFIEGGDQSVDLAEFGIEDAHEFEVLGRLKRIKYYTVKHHLGKEGGEANYYHKLGELSGKLPHVIYDTVNQLLSIAGGEYTILPEGIDN